MRPFFTTLIASSFLAAGLSLAPVSTAEARISDCTAYTWYAAWTELSLEVCEATSGDCVQERSLARAVELERYMACEARNPFGPGSGIGD
jgi:hypothetical protein